MANLKLKQIKVKDVTYDLDVASPLKVTDLTAETVPANNVATAGAVKAYAAEKGHTHPAQTSVSGNAGSANKLNTNAGSTTQPVYFADGVPKVTTYSLNKSVPADAKFTDTDTKNTAGATNTSSKIFLVGATEQTSNPQTYSHDTAYVGTDGCLYSNNTKVSVEGHGTHVTYATAKPSMDGTAAVGTSTKVAREDHIHPVDTSRAAQADLEGHTTDLDLHFSAAERNKLAGITVINNTADANKRVKYAAEAGKATNDIDGNPIKTTYTTVADFNTHNADNSGAHSDIRLAISNLSQEVADLSNLDEGTLAQMSALLEDFKESGVDFSNMLETDDIIDNLTSTSSTKVLSAAQGKALNDKITTHTATHAPADAEKNVQSDWKVTDTSSDAFIKNKPAIVNNLTTNDATKVLSAAQGKALKDSLDSHMSSHAPSNAQANQKAFGNIMVGSTTIAAGSTTDTIELAGSNVTITPPDETNESIKVTIGITKANVTTALGYTPPTTDTTYSVATADVAGLVKPTMSTNTSPTINNVSDTAGKYYHVVMNSTNGNMYVNVPWVNTNSDYVSKSSVGNQTLSSGLQVAGKIKENGSWLEDKYLASAAFEAVVEPATEGINYTLSSDGTSYCCNYSSSHSQLSGKIIIAKSINGKPVTSIQPYAFEECESITSVVIPEGVTSIGNSAFAGCTALKSVTLPNSLTKIESYAFCDTALESIVIPDSVTTIESRVFKACSALKDITLPFVGKCTDYTDQTEGLFGYIFGAESYNGGTGASQKYGSGDDDYITYYIPNSLSSVTITGNSIPTGAFYGCNHIRNISLSENVTSIGSWAFGMCTMLYEIKLPSKTYSFGTDVFEGCVQLYSVKIPTGPSYLNGTFKECGNLQYVSLPSGIIGFTETFQNCAALQRIELPEGLEFIGDSTFSGCLNLTEINIPESVTEIGERAFSSCTALRTLRLPASVAQIGDYAFYSTSSLKVVFSNNVDYLGTGAFRESSNAEVYFAGTPEDWGSLTANSGDGDLDYEGGTVHYNYIYDFIELNDKLATIGSSYTHPTYTARTGYPITNVTPSFGSAFIVSQITSDSQGHVTGATSRLVKIPNTTATTSTAGLMSAADKTKLNAVPTFSYSNGTLTITTT